MKEAAASGLLPKVLINALTKFEKRLDSQLSRSKQPQTPANIALYLLGEQTPSIYAHKEREIAWKVVQAK